MKINCARLLTFGLFLLFVTTASGQASEPQGLVERFLKLDFLGARLDSEFSSNSQTYAATGRVSYAW